MAWVTKGGMTDALMQANDEGLFHDIGFDLLTDIIMTRLRTSDGLDLDWIKDNLPDGAPIVKKIMDGASLGLDLGLAEHIESESERSLGTLKLVDPDGFLFSNSIISSIFVELGVDE